MTVYKIPAELSAVCFDIDNTLYRDDAYTESQILLLKKRLGREMGWPEEEVERRLMEVKQVTDQKQSHGNWFKMLGIPIPVSVAWREELIKPENFLTGDLMLKDALDKFDPCTLCALTNNPASVGRRTLEVLGVLDYFAFVIGLDDTWSSKPSPEPFIEIEKRLKIDPQQILMVGDRYEVDLAVPLSRGWGAVLVESMTDIYDLWKFCSGLHDPI